MPAARRVLPRSRAGSSGHLSPSRLRMHSRGRVVVHAEAGGSRRERGPRSRRRSGGRPNSLIPASIPAPKSWPGRGHGRERFDAAHGLAGLDRLSGRTGSVAVIAGVGRPGLIWTRSAQNCRFCVFVAVFLPVLERRDLKHPVGASTPRRRSSTRTHRSGGRSGGHRPGRVGR